jgi:hypothetical protein
MAADAFTASLASFISGRSNQTGRSLHDGRTTNLVEAISSFVSNFAADRRPDSSS